MSDKQPIYNEKCTSVDTGKIYNQCTTSDPEDTSNVMLEWICKDLQRQSKRWLCALKVLMLMNIILLIVSILATVTIIVITSEDRRYYDAVVIRSKEVASCSCQGFDQLVDQNMLKDATSLRDAEFPSMPVDHRIKEPIEEPIDDEPIANKPIANKPIDDDQIVDDQIVDN